MAPARCCRRHRARSERMDYAQPVKGCGQPRAAKRNAWRRLHADHATLKKRRRCTRTDALLPSSVGVSPRVAERSCRKAARGDLDALVRLAGRDPTQEPSRYAGGAAIGPADATRESLSCRSAGRLAKVASAGGGSRLPYSLYAAACCGSVPFRRLPAGRATSALMTVAQGPSRIMAAQQSGPPIGRTSRLST